MSTHVGKQPKMRGNAVGSRECVYLSNSDHKKKEHFYKWTDEGSDNDSSVKWCMSWRMCFEREAAQHAETFGAGRGSHMNTLVGREHRWTSPRSHRDQWRSIGCCTYAQSATNSPSVPSCIQWSSSCVHTGAHSLMRMIFHRWDD